MSRIIKGLGGFRVLLTLLVIGMITALTIVPGFFNVTDASTERTRKKDKADTDRLPKMYDIRDNASSKDGKDVSAARLESFRRSVGSDAAKVADIRDGFVRGEQQLRQTVPGLKIEYNSDIRIPEVISPIFGTDRIEFLTGPHGGSRVEALRSFLKGNAELIGLDARNIDQLKVGADYTNPDGNLSFVRLEQEINDVPVFRGELNAGYTKDGRIIRVINNLAPGIDEAYVSVDFGDPNAALQTAAEHVGFALSRDELAQNARASGGNVVKYGNTDWTPTAEKIYFPTEPGVAVPAWRILMWRGEAYYVIVDAETQTVLWHKNITDEQGQTASFQVYASSTSYLDVADSPAPLSPYISVPTIDPGVGAQGALITRSTRTLIGNEGSLNFNNNGWITDGTNITDGNATEAGIDRDATNGVDAAQAGDGAVCPGAGCRTFTSTWNPPPGNPAPGDDPLSAQAQRGAVIQMFYVMNRYHDELYLRGFVEAARNFQHANFGRGGSEGDRVSSEGQDNTAGCPGGQPCFNNANFSTPADGGRGRMQMYLFDGPTPDRDGTTDADIVIHEITHGTSNRLHGNSTGLGSQGGMMGEGWGDWYAHTMLAESGDPINGAYGAGGYATQLLDVSFTSNYYHGIRRFPKAVLAFTGGPQNRPHNPLTFADINTGCNINDGAFPPAPRGGTCSTIHNAGEIWSSFLWEVRALMVTRLGFTAGTQRVLQVVTDGMKLSPINPTMVQGRDAIIAAATALSFTGSPELAADAADVREGFRIRGMGFSASVQSTSVVTEAYDFPNVRHVDPFSAAEAPSGSDGDGFPEPGENAVLSVPVSNQGTGQTITNVQVNVNGGPNVNLGTINEGQTVIAQVPYSIPIAVPCGSMHQVTINVISSVAAQAPVIREFRVGAPVGGAPAVFTNNILMNIPSGLPGTTSGPAAPYSSDIPVSGLSGSKKIIVTLGQNGHEWPGDMDLLLESPSGAKMVIMSDAFEAANRPPTNIVTTMTIRDDAAAVMPGTGQWAATSEFRPTNYSTTDTFTGPAPAGPYLHPAPGGSATLASAFGGDGSAMNGTWKLWVVDDAGGDSGTMVSWSLTFESNEFVCNTVTVSGRAVSSAGRALAGVTFSITDGVTTRYARSSTFGYFSFFGVPRNTLHTVNAKAKRYTFEPQQLTPTGNVSGLVFTGTPQ